MKKRAVYSIIPGLILLFSCAANISAQRIEIIPFAGYETSAKMNSIKGPFRINDGMDFGASIALGRNAYKIELSYSRLASTLYFTDNTVAEPVSEFVSEVAVHNILIGGLLEFFQGDPVVPFLRVGLGSTYYQMLNSDTEDERVMNFNISGGAKLYLSEHFGFRFQAGLLLPMFFEGLYFEEAAPAAGEGMKTKISGVHGDFTTGVIFRF